MRVQINPTALTKYDIGWEQIQSTLTAANANRPKGQLSDGEQTWQLATTDQLFTAAEYRPLIITYKNGSPVRLSDIAKSKIRSRIAATRDSRVESRPYWFKYSSSRRRISSIQSIESIPCCLF